MSEEKFKPGEISQDSGQVEIVRGGRRTGVERTVVTGEPFPPTPKKGDQFVFVDKTKTQGAKPSKR